MSVCRSGIGIHKIIDQLSMGKSEILEGMSRSVVFLCTFLVCGHVVTCVFVDVDDHVIVNQ